MVNVDNASDCLGNAHIETHFNILNFSWLLVLMFLALMLQLLHICDVCVNLLVWFELDIIVNNLCCSLIFVLLPFIHIRTFKCMELFTFNLIKHPKKLVAYNVVSPKI